MSYRYVSGNGNVFYYDDIFHSKIHREDGPAIEWSDGLKEWAINGEYLTEQEFEAYRTKKVLEEWQK